MDSKNDNWFMFLVFIGFVYDWFICRRKVNGIQETTKEELNTLNK